MISPPDFAKSFFQEADALKASCEKGGAKYTREKAMALLQVHFQEATKEDVEETKEGTKLTKDVKDALFMSLVGGCGKNYAEMTTKEKGPAGIALADIARVTPNLTPMEISRRISRYRKAYPTAACTPMAIAAHWSEFGGSIAPTYAEEKTTAPKGWESHARAMFQAAEWGEKSIETLIQKGWAALGEDQQAKVRRRCNGTPPPPRNDSTILQDLGVSLCAKMVSDTADE